MKIWLALLVAPSLILLDLLLAYSMVTPMCARQTEELLHVVSLVFLTTALIFTALAAIEARRLRGAAFSVDADHADNRAYFIARVATWVGVLSSLVIIARWIPQWVLSPCVS